ncbi:MAG TPA: glycosyltransferase family 2 protein [Solirubrobacteraceae bacterium]|jgi:glycosyltransferase involved in cell wall biosynthesis|nr:glycosyltransferase family 2 protein [Solirubrobacteraceae bacterium]
MEALPITLCVSTRNAERHLTQCIDSARDWVSEIVIVDMDSDDRTREIARAAGAKVVEVPAAGWAEPGREAGLRAASQPWVLVLDADERAGPELATLAASWVARDDLDGVLLPRQNFQFGWWLEGSGIWPDWQLRLFRANSTTWPAHRTHVGAQVDGHVERAPAKPANAIVHHSFPSISAWVAGMNRYTELEARRLAEEGQRGGLLRLLGVPLARFAELYVVRRGYRGRRYGLAVALMSLCYWLMAELKLWELRLDSNGMPDGAVREL